MKTARRFLGASLLLVLSTLGCASGGAFDTPLDGPRSSTHASLMSDGAGRARSSDAMSTRSREPSHATAQSRIELLRR